MMRPSAESFPWVTGANCLSDYMPINLATSTGRAAIKIQGAISLFQRVFAPAAEAISTGKTAAQGGFFCYFSCPSRKVKEENQRGYMALDRKPLNSGCHYAE